MKRIRFLARLLALGFSGPEAMAIARACDEVRPLVAAGLDPCLGEMLAKALARVRS